MRREDIPGLVAFAVCLGFLLLVVPLLFVGILVYIAFLLILMWSAVRYRREGWSSGVLFALLASFPAWGPIGYWLYCLTMGIEW